MSSDILFSTLEKFHVGRHWGRFLDAGTGLHSIKWIQSLNTCTSFTAITADQGMLTQIQRDSEIIQRLKPIDSIIVGNWMDDSFCARLGVFDTILADYLIGAVDGFSPYEQDTIISRMKNHLTPNGRLYFIGMNPIPDETTEPACIVSEVRRARDSCILLAGHRPYREFPLSWVKRHMERAGFAVVASKNFTILHSEASIVRQVRVGQSKLSLVPYGPLKAGLEKYMNDLERRVKETVKRSNGKIPLSFDYVIAAEHAGAGAGVGADYGSHYGGFGGSGSGSVAGSVYSSSSVAESMHSHSGPTGAGGGGGGGSVLSLSASPSLSGGLIGGGGASSDGDVHHHQQQQQQQQLLYMQHLQQQQQIFQQQQMLQQFEVQRQQLLQQQQQQQMLFPPQSPLAMTQAQAQAQHMQMSPHLMAQGQVAFAQQPFTPLPLPNPADQLGGYSAVSPAATQFFSSSSSSSSSTSEDRNRRPDGSAS